MEIKGLSLSDQLKMMKGVESIKAPTMSKEGQGGPEKSNGISFSDYLMQQFDEVNKTGIESDKAIQKVLNGEEENPHAAMIALQKADISFKLLMAVKDRILEAYTQIIRTPIG